MLRLSLVLLSATAMFGQTYIQQNYDVRAYQFTIVNGSGVSGTLTSSGVGKVLTFTRAPKGTRFTASAATYLYISGGTGTAEAALITATTCPVAGQVACTVTVTTANTHSGAWSVQSATGGITEAACAIPAAGGEIVIASAITLYGNATDCGRSDIAVTRMDGAAITGAFTILGYSAVATPVASFRIRNVDTWNDTQHQSTLIASLGGANPVTQYRTAQNAPPGTQYAHDAIDGVVDVPSTSIQWEGAGLFGGVTNASTVTNGVAARLYSRASASGTNGSNRIKLWGVNTLMEDQDYYIPATYNWVELINEWDFNVGNINTVLIAQSIGGNSSAQPATALGYTCNLLGSSITWGFCFGSLDGAATTYASVGTQTAGATSAGQLFQFFSRSGGVSRTATVNLDTTGIFYISPGFATGGVTLQDGTASNIFAVTAGKATMGGPIVLAQYGSGSLPSAAANSGGVAICVGCTASSTPCSAGGANVMARSTGAQWNCGSF